MRVAASVPGLHEERVKAASIEEFISGTFRIFFEYVAADQSNFHAIRRNTDTLRVRVHTQEVIAGFEELREDLETAIAKGLFPPIDADYLDGGHRGRCLRNGRAHAPQRQS